MRQQALRDACGVAPDPRRAPVDRYGVDGDLHVLLRPAVRPGPRFPSDPNLAFPFLAVSGLDRRPAARIIGYCGGRGSVKAPTIGSGFSGSQRYPAGASSGVPGRRGMAPSQRHVRLPSARTCSAKSILPHARFTLATSTVPGQPRGPQGSPSPGASSVWVVRCQRVPLPASCQPPGGEGPPRGVLQEQRSSKWRWHHGWR